MEQLFYGYPTERRSDVLSFDPNIDPNDRQCTPAGMVKDARALTTIAGVLLGKGR
jgi:hypothetical protein